MTTEHELIDWFLEQAATAYRAEVEAMHKIRERVAFVSSILVTPVLGITVTTLFGFRHTAHRAWPFWFFVGPVGISIVLSVVASGIMVRSLVQRFAYSKPLYPAELVRYFKDGAPGADADAAFYDTKFRFMESYNKAVSQNAELNKTRMDLILQAQIVAAWSLPFLLLAMLAYMYSTVTTDQAPTKVFITNPGLVPPAPVTTHVRQLVQQSTQPTAPAATPSVPPARAGASSP